MFLDSLLKQQRIGGCNNNRTDGHASYNTSNQASCNSGSWVDYNTSGGVNCKTGGEAGCNTGGWVGYNASRERVNIDSCVIRLAGISIIDLTRANRSFLSKRTTLGCLQG